MDVITEHRLRMLGVPAKGFAEADERVRTQRIYDAFVARIPYENLSNNRATQEAPDKPECWPRATDRLLRENASLGLGGTSFSLAYALRDILHGAGISAHCTLAYNLVTEEAHAGVLVYLGGAPHLYDPSLLASGCIPIWPGGTYQDALGRFVLEPRCGATLTLTLRVRDELQDETPAALGPTQTEAWDLPTLGGRVLAVYSILPVPAPPHSFREAWQRSFRRGRAMPLRIARRLGDVIYRYGERPGSIEVLSPDGREVLPTPANPVSKLHEVFGIDTGCLEAWFDGAKNR